VLKVSLTVPRSLSAWQRDRLSFRRARGTSAGDGRRGSCSCRDARL